VLGVGALLVSFLLPLGGLVHGATFAAPTETVRPSPAEATQSADKPIVTLELATHRVTTAQGASAKAALSGARASALRSGDVRFVVKNASVTKRVRARVVEGSATATLPQLPRGDYRVHAVFLGNQDLAKARSDSRELKVVKRKGGGSTSGGSTSGGSTSGGSTSGGSTSSTGFPDASNTGVPAGTTLTPYSGSSTISQANTVIDGKTLGCIRVTAPGVVIRNSRISCAHPGSDVVGSFDGDYSGTPLLLEDVEIDCQNGPGTAVGDALVTVRRADIHGCENGFDMNQAITVEDSYIHDLWNSAESHTDGIQLASGHLVGSSYAPGALDITIRHNTIFGVGSDGSLGTSAIISNPDGDQNVLIQGNLLAGGAYTLYCDRDGGQATSYQILDNHFSREFSSKVGAYGPSDGCADDTQSGNVYDDTGAALQLD